ncbi:MAG: methylated-DNA--[protein]-cysteine S-methyltransferase [Bacteroidota bacterium]
MKNAHHGNKVEKAIRYIADNYRRQPSLEEIADQVHLSKYHFQRMFHEWAGVTPKQFLQYITVEHAKKCLHKGQSTLTTAYDVGLSGNGRLHDMFVKIIACTPGEFQKRGEGMSLKYGIIDSPFGKLVIAESSLGISQMEFLPDQASPLELLESIFPEARFHQGPGAYGQMVQEYFDTWKTPKKRIVLDLRGTPFQVSVWRALLSVPPAHYLAYKDIAQMINKPNAIRAVGTAVGRNPIAYLIPCHRIIRESGEIGEYGWGKHKKLLINGFENANLRARQSA